MNIKNALSKFGKTFYQILFMISVFLITSTFLAFIPFWFARKFELNVFNQNTGELNSFGNIIYYYLAGILLGFISAHYLQKFNWLKKISPLIILLSFPISMANTEVGMLGEIELLNHSVKRMNILHKIYGDKVEPCDVLHLGDKIEKAVALYGEPAIDSSKEEKSFALPFSAPLFEIKFNTKNMLIIDMECFDSNKKAN